SARGVTAPSTPAASVARPRNPLRDSAPSSRPGPSVVAIVVLLPRSGRVAPRVVGCELNDPGGAATARSRAQTGIPDRRIPDSKSVLLLYFVSFPIWNLESCNLGFPRFRVDRPPADRASLLRSPPATGPGADDDGPEGDVMEWLKALVLGAVQGVT